MRLTTLLTLCVLVAATQSQAQKKVYVKDLKFATKEIGKISKVLIKDKKLPWKKISKTFTKEAAKAKNHSEYCRLLIRLLARLEDGHAGVLPGASAPKNIKPFPEFDKHTGAGMLLCRTGDKIYVKSCGRSAKSAGLDVGMEIVSVGGTKSMAWLAERVALHRDYKSFSTDQHAEFFALQKGLTAEKGTRWKIVVKDKKGRTKKKNLTFERAKQFSEGPAFFPKDIQTSKQGNVHFGKTEQGYGYIHIRRCKSSVVSEVDEALASVSQVKGMILDFRGNTGGSFDHAALMGRFVPKGKTMSFNSNSRYKSAGAVTYGGPIVVIVDGSVVSAGETASGMFKEDGRGYMIGASPTAGMSSSKKEVELPSGLFKLKVSVYSNKKRFNGGKGIEGIGVPPHEIVQHDPKDLQAGVDTLTQKAEKLLSEFPQKQVPYEPKKFGN
ncbi:MAG: carboxyl-terminal processing protease [Planctomycetota bacterium]|jgi:carboxyl-terminal processing protease